MRLRAAITIALIAAIAVFWRCGRDLPPPPDPGHDGAAATAVDAASSSALGAQPARAEMATAHDDGAALRSPATTTDPFAAARTGYRGRVVSRSGAAVPGMTVRLFRGSPDIALLPGLDPFAREPVAPELEAARATTQGDGSFRLDGVAPRGLCWIRLEWNDVRAAPLPLRAGHRTIVPVQRAPAPGEVIDLGDLVLKPGAVLTGRVVDDRGQPIEAALVRAANLPPLPFAAAPIERLGPDSAVVVTMAGRSGAFELPRWFGKAWDALPIASTTSAGDGTFVLYGVDPGTAVLAVTGAGRASLLRQGLAIAPDSTTSLGELVLPEGATAEVSVRAPDGKPVVGAEVIVASISAGFPAHLGERVGTTDAEGHLTATGLPRGGAIAAARRLPQDPWVLGEPGSSDGRLAVVLPGKCHLVLDVLDQGNVRARDVKLQLVAGQQDAGVLELAMFGMERGVDLRQRLRTQEDGRLRIDDLDRGPWRLVVTAKDCGITSLHLDLQGDTERTVQLRPARSLPVRVLDAAGEPVEGAALFAQARGGSRQERIVDVPLHQGTTDAQGRCTLRDLPTAESRVTASHPLHGQVHAIVQGTPPGLELRFLAAGAIRGRLTDGGKAPVPGRWLAVLERRYDAANPRGAMPDLPQLALPDLDGTFAFGALQPGNYRVTAQDSVTDVTTVGGVFQYLARRKQIFPWNKADVTLHGGEQLEVRLDTMLDVAPYDGPGAIVRGLVTIDGAPGDGALVVGTSSPGDRRVTSRVDRSGAFDLGHCPAGALRVVVVPREVAESRLLEHLFSHHFAQNVTVMDGQPLRLDIDVATGSLRGEVRDWNGAAVQDCRVVLFDRGGKDHSSSLRTGRTDGRGAFAFAQLPVGVYELRAQKDGFGKVTTADVAITAGGSALPVVVTLVPIGRLRGRIDIATLRRGRRWLALQPTAGGETVRTLCDEDGRFDLKDVPFARYRATTSALGDPAPTALGELVVAQADLIDVVLTPR